MATTKTGCSILTTVANKTHNHDSQQRKDFICRLQSAVMCVIMRIAVFEWHHVIYILVCIITIINTGEKKKGRKKSLVLLKKAASFDYNLLNI